MEPDKTSFWRRHWRTFGYWGLTLNVVFLPAVFVIVPAYAPETNLSISSGHFPMMMGAWIAAAAVRQWGKNNGEK